MIKAYYSHTNLAILIAGFQKHLGKALADFEVDDVLLKIVHPPLYDILGKPTQNGENTLTETLKVIKETLEVQYGIGEHLSIKKVETNSCEEHTLVLTHPETGDSRVLVGVKAQGLYNELYLPGDDGSLISMNVIITQHSH